MRIESGPRTSGRAAKKTRTTELQGTSPVDGTAALNELDTRADTICCGINWKLINTTGQQCNVSGFHDSFDSIPDVPVATAATAYTTKDGTTYILIVNEALYFGGSLDHSLINPNQIRHYGIPVSDDPYDSGRPFGMDHNDLFLPFETSGSAVHFISHVPSESEMQSCPKIVLTDGVIEWDPKNVVMSPNRPYGDPIEVDVRKVKTENQRRMNIACECETDMVLSSMPDYQPPDQLYQRLIESVNITYRTASVVDRKIDKTKSNLKMPHKAGRTMGKVTARNRHSKVTPEHIAKLMNISLEKAKQMLRVTTQENIRTAVNPITRRYRVDHLALNTNQLGGQWYIDWVSAGTLSLNQNKGAFVITNGRFSEVYPSRDNKSIQANTSLNEFCQSVGVPGKLKSDRAPEFCGPNTVFLDTAQKKGIDLTYSEPERKNQIAPIDIEIRELRKRTHDKLASKNAPRRLWDWCLQHQAHVRQMLPRDQLNGRTAMEQVTGKTPDISELCDFDFYDLVWYHPGPHPNFGDELRKLGRWLGIAHRIGSELCYWILTKDGNVIAETTVQHVTREDMQEEAISTQVHAFNAAVVERLSDANFILEHNEGRFKLLDEYENDYDLPQWDPAYGGNDPTDAEYGASPDDMPEADDLDIDKFDKYIGARVILDDRDKDGGNIATKPIGIVTGRSTDAYGYPIGRAHKNPMLDTREFDIELENGEMEKILANKIAENLYSQLDDEGRDILAFRGIIDHKSDKSAVSKEKGLDARDKPKITTRGWKILVEWKDETSTWMNMKDVKEANPVELAEYALANGIDDEPAFKWWVPYTLKKRDRIIAKIKTKYWKTTHKYGVRLPKSVEEALKLDAETGTTFWSDAVKKEMAKAQVAYEEMDGIKPEDVRAGKVPELRSFQEISCHIIFDVKMDFTRKARYVAGGHTTETPVGICYSSVVSRDSVRIAFLVAALNDLDILATDIGNAYLNAPCREKIWFEAGLECGHANKGKVMKLVRALYGLKSSGASWRHMFKTYIETRLGFKPCVMDGDLYYRRQKRPDGSEYYELLLVYVDDVLVCSHDPKTIMESLAGEYVLKDGYEEPKIYLGADIVKVQNVDLTYSWAMGSKSYVKGALDTVKRLLAEDGRAFKSRHRHDGPLPKSYKPELDTTPECDAELTSRYQQLIGILRWAVELGRIDIQIEVAIMSSYQMSPRTGHLEALYLIFHFLDKHPCVYLVMDQFKPTLDETYFEQDATWKEFYGDVQEEMPPNMPEPLGTPVSTLAMTDSDHASNVVTRRSHSGILIFVNSALILAYSKKQNTVEASTYGAELVALRISRDLIVALRLKLRSIGVPIEGPTTVLCDNNGVVKNTSIPTSTLAKKHNSINYHIVREAAAAGIIRVGKEQTESNKADVLTKLQDYKRKTRLLKGVCYEHFRDTERFAKTDS